MKLEILKGTTSKILRIFIQDSSSGTGAGLTGLVFNSAGLTCHYSREGAATETAVTLVTATEGTYTSSGFIEMDATDLPGFYELGIPDAALATGADSVIIMLKGATNMVPLPIEIQLVDRRISPVHINLGLIKQSTNAHVLIGPVINSETGAVITSLTLGDVTAARIIQTTTITRTGITLAGSGNNEFTHEGDGYWEFDMTTTDTGTAGKLTFTFRDDDLFHPITATGIVVPANIYDSFVGGTDVLDASLVQVLGTAVTESTATAGVLDVNVAEISDSSAAANALEASINTLNDDLDVNVIRISADSTAADNLESYCDGTTPQPVDITSVDGTAAYATIMGYLLDAAESYTVDTTGFSPTTTQFESTATEATADHYKDGRVFWVDGVLEGQAKNITAYSLVGGRGRFTCDAFTDAPASGNRFIIVP